MQNSETPNKQLEYLKDTVFLISGSRQGLGLALAKHFTNCGATVIGCSRQKSGLEHPNYTHYQVDITQEIEVSSLIKEIKKTGQHIDILINNAGVSDTAFINILSSDSISKSLEINTLGNILLTKASLKLMRKRRQGRIINISSIHVPLCSPGASIYSASKAALEQFARVIAKEVYHYGITVNTLSLSVVENLGMANELSHEAKEKLLSQTTTQKPVTIPEIAHAIDFLSSDYASSVTGQTIVLGGA